jgi:hypothetical protein
MIMTSAVEARIHAVAPESIAIHFTCDEQTVRFAPVRGGWFPNGAPDHVRNPACDSPENPKILDFR